MDSSPNNKIAKNTVFLYLRMFIILGVTLYTSRIILSYLGVTDYGIYNVVGGVAAMFSFISMAMGNATVRFVTFALGREDVVYQNKVFNTAIQIHLLIAILVLFLGETVGLWFLIHKIVIPEERVIAAYWTYPFSILAAMVNIMYIPFNSLIIAHEKMNVYAYISINDVFLKLLIVFLLKVSPFDKLVAYSFLFLCVNIINTIIYYWYCHKNFHETRFQKVYDRAMVKEMGSFAGWSMIGNLALVGYTQGLNIVLNMFFGPVVNAARGVSVQVQSAAKMFVRNFQTAVNPQITMSYAQDNNRRVCNLVNASTRLSFYLVYCIVLPICLEADKILSFWLVEVPEHTVWFLRLILLVTLIDAFEGPVNTAINATGRIKKYQIVSCSILLLVLPVAYICLKLGYSPESVFIVQFIFILLAFIAELVILAPMIHLSLGNYFKDVVLRIFIVFVASSSISLLIYKSVPDTFYSLFINVPVAILSVWLFAYLFGISKVEREVVNNYVRKLFCKVNK